LNVNQNGVLSGTPPSPGTSKVVVIVRDKNGASVTKEYDLKTAPPKVP
jgi:hypothetical protein